MNQASQEERMPKSAGSLHNEPTSVWIPADGASTVSSITREAPPLDESYGASTTEVSLPSEPSTEEMLSSSGDLHFSKRGSEISDEAQHMMLKPAALLETKRSSERMLPVSTLRFESLGLVGRDKEKAILETRLKIVAAKNVDENQKGNRELVLVSGEAGTGKTALALTVTKPVKKLGGLFVKGKFDLYLRDEPYAGFAPVCREVCGRLLQIRDGEKRHDASFESIRDELIEKLGSENLQLLINVVPELSEIVGDEIIMDEYMKKQRNEESKARLNYAFRILFRVVAGNFAPLVILLDDIQWSDAATLDLLKVLITDRDNPSLMVVGVYRSNEVDDTHILSRLVVELTREADQEACLALTKIEIGNLDTPQVNEIIMKLLSIDDPKKTMGLAHVCHKRSLGNVFSLLIFLEMLKEEGLLQFNLGKFKWRWDEEKILSDTAATANVVDLMRQKIERLANHDSQRLSVAACLGFSFDPAVLDTVWHTICRQQHGRDEHKENDEKHDDANDWLALVEQEGFLEKEQGNTSYRWVHDKVQEAAMSLVPSNELPTLKAQVGNILVSELADEDLDSYIFTVVNLLQEGPIPTDDLARVELAQLSLRASKKAYELSAFESSGKYAAIGVQVLPADRWSNHYELTLDLYSTAAEVEGYLGNTEHMEKCYNEVLEQRDRPLSDKLRVYNAMISYMSGALGKPQDAIELLVEILAQLGIRFPKRKGTRLVSTIAGAIKAKRKMLSLSLEDIANMLMMDDSVHLETMRLLDQLFLAAYLANSDLFPLAIFAGTRLTLKNGLSEYSAPLFASLALILGAALGDTALASKTGSFSRLVMTKVECKNMNSKADLFLHAFVFCWTEPMANMLSPLTRAYETGLSVGDNESACWCIAQYIVIGFQSGKSLRTLETDCRTYRKQMLEFKRETVYTDICIYLESIQNLMGLSEGDPTIMQSDEHFLSQTDHTVLGVFYSFRSILYMYFGEFEKGADLAVERGDTYATGIPKHVWIMIETFARGMSLYAMARKTRKRVYVKHAKQVHKTIKSWLRKRNPNVKHYDFLFNAELAALQRKLDAAEGWYQSAIVSATRQGCIHESALASERYGEFLLERNDKEEARHKFDDALRRYREWGAIKKVDMLREKHQELWEKPGEIVVGLDPPVVSKLGFSREFTLAPAVPTSNDASKSASE